MYKNYKAETVDEAIALGLEELKVAEEDIKIDVLEGGSKGFLGLGKKNAEVKLTVINPELKSYDTIDALINRDQPGEEKSMVDEVLEERSTEEETAETEAPKEEPETHENNETVDETDENKTPAGAAKEAPAEEAAATEETVATAEPAEDETEKTEDDLTFDEAISETSDYLHSVITEMNIENTVTYEVNNNTGHIELESALAAKLIGKRGQTLNALQEIGQNYLNTIYRSYGVIVLDIENYRDKRRQTLENLAINMSKKALRTQQPVKLEPMPSFERKIMHNVLSDLENISTHSEGNEPNRYLVIEKK